ncbi:hypothetical protein GCM10010339_77440 [Streptomyces alanosinicus]|uniref:Secreted protein n=2 Tax=Streptomyces alanosinicus TaxID=68171 RepID=A0A918YRA3_9ACTN|nr:hypothetical protein GCM10010339_77440 [Streptomyces alanosinicus]
MRPGRVGLFLGLVLLVTAHLTGAVHAASFAGSHLTVEVTARAQLPADAGHEDEPAPAHQHRAGDHIDHAADRPRTAADETVTEPGHTDPADGPSGPAGVIPLPGVRCRPSATPVSTGDAPGTLALHCVWRL